MLTGNAAAFDFVVNHNGNERGATQDGQCTLREAISPSLFYNTAGAVESLTDLIYETPSFF
jgi:hypothetical protein